MPPKQLWKARIRSLLSRNPTLKAMAKGEREAIEGIINDVYQRNLQLLLRGALRTVLENILIEEYDYQAVNDMFLHGIILEALENQPPLPTAIFDRSLIHMAAYLMKSEDITLQGALDRTNKAEQLYNQALPFYDTILDRGRQAYRDKSDHHLIACHHRVTQQGSGDSKEGSATTFAATVDVPKLIDITASQVEALSEFLVRRIQLVVVGGL